MGVSIVGAPAAYAQSRMAANGASGAAETSTTSTPAAPAASSPADLDRRIEMLETELAELRTALAAKKTEEPAATPAATPAAAPQDKPAEKTTIASLLGPTSISGFVDTYYQANFNHPVGRDADYRAFDFRDKSISLGMIELILDKAPDPMGGAAGRTGYHVSVGFGDAMNTVNGADPAGPQFAQYLKEAYFSYLAPVGKGLQFDVGKFVTPMGAEVIEAKDNWNYSRGLLFTWAIPFYHFGARAKYTFNDKYNITGFVTNGWNNIVDNNSGKTYGFSFASNPTKKVSYTVNYLAGPEQPTGSLGLASTGPNVLTNVNDFWRQTWDGIVTYNPTSKWSFMANFDYGRGDRNCINGCEDVPALLTTPISWYGGAGYAKYAPTMNDYFAVRYEYLEDHDGTFTASGTPDGNDVFPRIHFHEVTATYQRTLASYLLARVEYRRDMSQFPVYDISNFGIGTKHQDTIALGLIFLFDSRNAK